MSPTYGEGPHLLKIAGEVVGEFSDGYAIQEYMNTQTKHNITYQIIPGGGSGSQLMNHILDNQNPNYTTKLQVGLGNVDNTSDINKPISSATQTALTNLNTSLTSAIAVKANSSDVYTKSEVYTKLESDSKYHQKLSIDVCKQFQKKSIYRYGMHSKLNP